LSTDCYRPKLPGFLRRRAVEFNAFKEPSLAIVF
jgi:hypothetical protein